MNADDDISSEQLLQRYALGERRFVGVSLADGSVLKGVNLQGATFEEGFFSDVDVRFANLKGTTFRNMNLKCTDFRQADLTDAVFDGVLIEGAAFSGATVKNTEFTRMLFHGKAINNFKPNDWV